MSRNSIAARFAPAPFPLGVAALLGAGACASPSFRASPEQAIESSVGASITFHWEGAPADLTPAAGEAISFPVALRRAVEGSAELQASLARVRAAQAEADLASLLPNPVLSLVFRFPEEGGATRIEAGLAGELLAILQRPRRSRIAGHRLQAESALALTTALDVVAELEQRYLAVQALEELVPLVEQRGAVLERLREVAQARLELGQGTRLDLTTLDSERSALSVELAARRQELRIARLALARAIGEPSSAADWRLEPWSAPAPVTVDEPTWLRAALASRPEILEIEWELRAREQEEGLARGGAYPGASLGVDAERDGDWSLGPAASAPLPLFDRGGARKERARALSAEQRHRLTEAQRTVIEDVRTSLAALAGAQENLTRVDRELLPLQRQRRSEIEEAYRQGFADVTAVLLADQALQRTRATRVELARDVALARSRLGRAVGGPVLAQSIPREVPRP